MTRELAAFRLRPEQLAAFERDGFVAGIEVFDAVACARVRAAVQEIIDHVDVHEPRLYEVERAWREKRDEVVCHFLGGWRVQQALRDAVFSPAMVVPCAQLLGVEDLRFWHDQVFAKPPGHPGGVPWHQDYSYWTRTAPACHITVNVMLDDADEENGCLCFVPGSHRWGLLPPLPFDSQLEALVDRLPPGARFEPVAAPLRAGQATIHHSHTLHGSRGNRSTRWRRAAVFNYMGGHVRVADGREPLLRGAAPIATGELVAGELFPLVMERGKLVEPR